MWTQNREGSHSAVARTAAMRRHHLQGLIDFSGPIRRHLEEEALSLQT